MWLQASNFSPHQPPCMLWRLQCDTSASFLSSIECVKINQSSNLDNSERRSGFANCTSVISWWVDPPSVLSEKQKDLPRQCASSQFFACVVQSTTRNTDLKMCLHSTKAPISPKTSNVYSPTNCTDSTSTGSSSVGGISGGLWARMKRSGSGLRTNSSSFISSNNEQLCARGRSTGTEPSMENWADLVQLWECYDERDGESQISSCARLIATVNLPPRVPKTDVKLESSCDSTLTVDQDGRITALAIKGKVLLCCFADRAVRSYQLSLSEAFFSSKKLDHSLLSLLGSTRLPNKGSTLSFDARKFSEDGCGDDVDPGSCFAATFSRSNCSCFHVCLVAGPQTGLQLLFDAEAGIELTRSDVATVPLRAVSAAQWVGRTNLLAIVCAHGSARILDFSLCCSTSPVSPFVRGHSSTPTLLFAEDQRELAKAIITCPTQFDVGQDKIAAHEASNKIEILFGIEPPIKNKARSDSGISFAEFLPPEFIKRIRCCRVSPSSTSQLAASELDESAMAFARRCQHAAEFWGDKRALRLWMLAEQGLRSKETAAELRQLNMCGFKMLEWRKIACILGGGGLLVCRPSVLLCASESHRLDLQQERLGQQLSSRSTHCKINASNDILGGVGSQRGVGDAAVVRGLIKMLVHRNIMLGRKNVANHLLLQLMAYTRATRSMEKLLSLNKQSMSDEFNNPRQRNDGPSSLANSLGNRIDGENTINDCRQGALTKSSSPPNTSSVRRRRSFISKPPPSKPLNTFNNTEKTGESLIDGLRACLLTDISDRLMPLESTPTSNGECDSYEGALFIRECARRFSFIFDHPSNQFVDKGDVDLSARCATEEFVVEPLLKRLQSSNASCLPPSSSFASTAAQVGGMLLEQGSVLQGAELLCLAGRISDACLHLQLNDQWHAAAVLAKVRLPKREREACLIRWCNHLSETGAAREAAEVFVSLGMLSEASAALRRSAEGSVAPGAATALVDAQMLYVASNKLSPHSRKSDLSRTST